MESLQKIFEEKKTFPSSVSFPSLSLDLFSVFYPALQKISLLFNVLFVRRK